MAAEATGTYHLAAALRHLRAAVTKGMAQRDVFAVGLAAVRGVEPWDATVREDAPAFVDLNTDLQQRGGGRG